MFLNLTSWYKEADDSFWLVACHIKNLVDINFSHIFMNFHFIGSLSHDSRQSRIFLPRLLLHFLINFLATLKYLAWSKTRILHFFSSSHPIFSDMRNVNKMQQSKSMAQIMLVAISHYLFSFTHFQFVYVSVRKNSTNEMKMLEQHSLCSIFF